MSNIVITSKIVSIMIKSTRKCIVRKQQILSIMITNGMDIRNQHKRMHRMSMIGSHRRRWIRSRTRSSRGCSRD